MNPQTDRAAAIVEQYGCKTENLIAILQDIQAAYNYLSEANLTLVADRLGISVSKVYSVATFYENFSLEAKGRHIIKVCAGTACHVRKSGPIYDAIYEYLGLSGKRRTSDDGMFTLETVACLGACGLAPVMTVDGEVHAKMSPDQRPWSCWRRSGRRRPPNEADPRRVLRPAQRGPAGPAPQQGDPLRADLRRYRLHRRRRHEDL